MEQQLSRTGSLTGITAIFWTKNGIYMQIHSLNMMSSKTLILGAPRVQEQGIRFLKPPLLNLSISAGLAKVDENFDVAEDDDYTAGQWSVNYDQYFFKKFVQLFHVSTGYVGFEDTNDWFYRTRTGLRFPVYKGFTATVQYNYDYDHHPSEDAEDKEDTKFIFLLGYEFKN
jgi:hypothetical protein